MVFEYIQERFRTAYKYFACPQRRGTGGRQRGKKAGKQGAKLEGVQKKDAAFVNKEEDDGKVEKSQSTQRVHQGLKDDEEPDSDDEGGSDTSRKKDEKTLDASLMDMVLNEGNKPSFSPNGLLDSDKEGEEAEEAEEEEEEEDEDDEEQSSVSEKDEPVTSEDLHYVFDKMIFTGGKVIMTNTIHPLRVFYSQ